MEFYVNLYSNACSQIFPSNKTSDFRNKLSDVIQLSAGEWEVCLFDISYVYGHVLIAKDEHICTVAIGIDEKRRFVRINTRRDIRSIEDLIEELKERLDPLDISVHNRKFSMMLNKTTFYSLYLADKVTAILGFTENGIVLNKTEHENCLKNATEENLLKAFGVNQLPNYVDRFIKSGEDDDEEIEFGGDLTCFEQAGWTKLLVYTNIIEPQYVADVRAKCLKSVPYKGTYGEICHHSFLQSQYVNVSVSSLELIHIYLLSETGQHIKFDFSPVCITLKFRQKRLR